MIFGSISQLTELLVDFALNIRSLFSIFFDEATDTGSEIHADAFSIVFDGATDTDGKINADAD